MEIYDKQGWDVMFDQDNGDRPALRQGQHNVWIGDDPIHIFDDRDKAIWSQERRAFLPNHSVVELFPMRASYEEVLALWHIAGDVPYVNHTNVAEAIVREFLRQKRFIKWRPEGKTDIDKDLKLFL